MSDKESGVLVGLRKSLSKFTTGITSKVVETAMTRFLQAGVEVGLDVTVQMLRDGIGPNRTVAILKDAIAKIEKEQAELASTQASQQPSVGQEARKQDKGRQ